MTVCRILGHRWPKNREPIQWCQRCGGAGRVNPLIVRIARRRVAA